MKHRYLGLMIILPFFTSAVSMPINDIKDSEKIIFMQLHSKLNQPLYAAYVQTDQTFTQWCGKTASVSDLKRIANQKGFSELLLRLTEGKIQGLAQTKTLLVNNNPKFCKE